MFLPVISLMVLVPLSAADANYKTSQLKTVSGEELEQIIQTNSKNQDLKWVDSKDVSRFVPADNGGNFGDLIYGRRVDRDVLLLREVVVLDEISSSELGLEYYTRLNADAISSVRVLNIGRERAYCRRIDVGGNEARAYLRVPPGYDPRILIEVYGF